MLEEVAAELALCLRSLVRPRENARPLLRPDGLSPILTLHQKSCIDRVPKLSPASETWLCGATVSSVDSREQIQIRRSYNTLVRVLSYHVVIRQYLNGLVFTQIPVDVKTRVALQPLDYTLQQACACSKLKAKKQTTLYEMCEEAVCCERQ